MDADTIINDLLKIRLVNEIDLTLDRLSVKMARIRAQEHGVDYDCPKFYGHNPLTGMPCTIIFNEPSPSRSKVMNWNTLTKCWFYSDDAGLTWKRIDTKEDFIQHLSKTDCLMDTEYQPVFE